MDRDFRRLRLGQMRAVAVLAIQRRDADGWSPVLAETSSQAAAARRRHNFLSGSVRDDRTGPDAEARGDEHQLLQRAEEQLTVTIQSIAHSHGLGALPTGDVAAMVQKAAPKLKSMSRSALKSLSPSSPVLFELAISSLAPVLTPDAVERFRLEQIKAAFYGTGSMPTDDQILRGERPGPCAHDAFARYAVGANGGGDSSRNYLVLAGERFTPQQQFVIAGARAEAQRQGVAWFGNPTYQRDLLSIGASGVKAIADVRLNEPSYQRLRTDGRFEAREVVTLAGYAKAKGIIDANGLAHATVDVVQTAKSDGEQLRIKGVILDYMAAAKAASAAPDDAAAQQRLEHAGIAQRAMLVPIAAQSEDNYRRVQTYEDKAKVEARFRATAATQEATAVARAEVAKAAKSGTGDLLAELNGPPPGKPTAAQPVAPPSAAKAGPTPQPASAAKTAPSAPFAPPKPA